METSDKEINMDTLNATQEQFDDLIWRSGADNVMRMPKLDPEYLEQKLDQEDEEAIVCG